MGDIFVAIGPGLPEGPEGPSLPGPGSELPCTLIGNCEGTGNEPINEGPILNIPEIPGNYYYPVALDWSLLNAATGDVDAISMADGVVFSAPLAILAGAGDDWTFSSEQTISETKWLAPGQAYADQTRPPVDLAIVTQRKRNRDSATGTAFKTIVSNYSNTTANLVQVRLSVSRLDETTHAPQLTLNNYDDCTVYDDTVAVRGTESKSIALPAESDSELSPYKQEMICALGTLPAGQTITLNWQLDSAGDKRYIVRSTVSGSDFDPTLENNADINRSSSGGGSSAVIWLLIPLGLLGWLRTGRRRA